MMVATSGNGNNVEALKATLLHKAQKLTAVDILKVIMKMMEMIYRSITENCLFCTWK